MSGINRIVGSRRTLDRNDDVVTPSGPAGKLALEDESGFILTEDGDYITQED